MKYTNKQRRKFYTETAVEIFNKNLQDRKFNRYGGRHGFCDYLNLDDSLEEYPEYKLFKPSYPSLYWFETNGDQKERILALLLSAEIAKN